jgi:hypothetical protein
MPMEKYTQEILFSENAKVLDCHVGVKHVVGAGVVPRVIIRYEKYEEPKKIEPYTAMSPTNEGLLSKLNEVILTLNSKL